MQDQRTIVIVEGPDLPASVPALVLLRGAPIAIVAFESLATILARQNVSLVVVCQANDALPTRELLRRRGCRAALVLLSTQGLTPFVRQLKQGVVDEVVLTSLSDEAVADRIVLLDQRARSGAVVAPGLRSDSRRSSAPPPPNAPTTSLADLPPRPGKKDKPARASAPPPPARHQTSRFGSRVSLPPPPPLPTAPEPPEPSLSELPTTPWNPPPEADPIEPEPIEPEPIQARALEARGESLVTSPLLAGTHRSWEDMTPGPGHTEPAPSGTSDVEGVAASMPPPAKGKPREFSPPSWAPWAVTAGGAAAGAALIVVALAGSLGDTGANGQKHHDAGSGSSAAIRSAAPVRSEAQKMSDTPSLRTGGLTADGPSAVAPSTHGAGAEGASTDEGSSTPVPATVDERFAVEPAPLESCSEILDEPSLALNEAQKLSPTDERRLAFQHRKRAQADLLTGRDDEAKRQLCLSVAYAPSGPGTKLLANLLLSQRAPRLARGVVERALQAEPNHAAYLELLGDVASQLGQPEQARKFWLQSLDIADSDTARQRRVARHWFQAALELKNAGAHDRAERVLRRVVTLHPGHSMAAQLLAQTFARQGETRLARIWQQQAEQHRASD